MKPIEKVYIEASGDPSVGIPSSHFEATCWIERGQGEDYDPLFIEELRRSFKELYSDMIGEEVGVLFDFEFEAREEVMRRMEEQGEMT